MEERTRAILAGIRHLFSFLYNNRPLAELKMIQGIGASLAVMAPRCTVYRSKIGPGGSIAISLTPFQRTTCVVEEKGFHSKLFVFDLRRITTTGERTLLRNKMVILVALTEITDLLDPIGRSFLHPVTGILVEERDLEEGEQIGGLPYAPLFRTELNVPLQHSSKKKELTGSYARLAV